MAKRTLFVALFLGAVILLCRCENDPEGQYTWSWSDCGSKESDVMKIKHVSFSEMLNATYSLDREISNGTIHVSMTYGVVPSYADTIPLCHPLKCPVKAGGGYLAIENPFKVYFPPGTYTLSEVVKDEGDKELACFKVEIKQKYSLEGK